MPRKAWTEETPYIIAELCADEFAIERERNDQTLDVATARRAIKRVYTRKHAQLTYLPSTDASVMKVIEAYCDM
jgi:hypothetical protein